MERFTERFTEWLPERFTEDSRQEQGTGSMEHVSGMKNTGEARMHRHLGTRESPSMHGLRCAQAATRCVR